MTKLIAISLVVAAAGCGVAVDQRYVNTPPHAMVSRDPSTVAVYTAGPPSRARVDLAEMWAYTNLSGVDAGIAGLRERAAWIGCDAIVVRPERYQRIEATCEVWDER